MIMAAFPPSSMNSRIWKTGRISSTSIPKNLTMDKIAYCYENSIIEPADNVIDRRLSPQRTDSARFGGRVWLFSSLTPKAENIDSSNALPHQLDHSDPSIYDILKSSKHSQKFLELVDCDRSRYYSRARPISLRSLCLFMMPLKGLIPGSLRKTIFITISHQSYSRPVVLRTKWCVYASCHTSPERSLTSLYQCYHSWIHSQSSEAYHSSKHIHIKRRYPCIESIVASSSSINSNNPIHSQPFQHISPNSTLYSNHFYTGNYTSLAHETMNDTQVKVMKPFPGGIRQFQLPSHIGGRRMRVETTRYGWMISMKVDGKFFLGLQDGYAADGVVHIVNCLLLPPVGQGGDGWD